MNNKSSNSRRQYHSDVRSARKEETRQHILDILVEKMVHENFALLSMDDIAGAAGVGIATLYRHFPNREALLDGLSSEFNRRVGSVSPPRTSTEIAENIARDFKVFDEHPGLVQAFFMSELGRNARSRGRAKRIEAIRTALQEVTQRLEEPERTQIIAVIAYLASLQSWVTMTSEFGLTGEQAGQAVAWAIQTLLASLTQHSTGDHPDQP